MSPLTLPGQDYGENDTVAGVFGANATAVSAGDQPRNVQPQSQVTRARCRAHRNHRVEYLRTHTFGKRRAGVADGKFETVAHGGKLNSDRIAGSTEFDCIAHEFIEHLDKELR